MNNLSHVYIVEHRSIDPNDLTDHMTCTVAYVASSGQLAEQFIQNNKEYDDGCYWWWAIIQTEIDYDFDSDGLSEKNYISYYTRFGFGCRDVLQPCNKNILKAFINNDRYCYLLDFETGEINIDYLYDYFDAVYTDITIEWVKQSSSDRIKETNNITKLLLLFKKNVIIKLIYRYPWIYNHNYFPSNLKSIELELISKIN